MKYKYAINKLDKEKTAKAVGISIGVSAKHSKEVCDMIRGKKANTAVVMLKQVIDMKKPVPYKKFHREKSCKNHISSCKEIKVREEKIKQETKATIRCIPFDMKEENGVCLFSGKSSEKRVLFAKAY